MSVPLMPARTLGLIGLLSFYQEFYGTCVYFLSFVLNKRYKTLKAHEIGLFVCFTNGLCPYARTHTHAHTNTRTHTYTGR